MKYGDTIEEIKRLLRKNEIPHFVCDDCASIVIADSKSYLNRDGEGFELDRNDPRLRFISQDILDSLKDRHKQLHAMPDNEYDRKRQMEWVEYGKAIETILKLAGEYNGRKCNG